MKKLDILVVDDNQLYRKAAEHLLAEHNVATARTLVEALKLMGHKTSYDEEIVGTNYDVVLTDMMFPMGGRRSADIVNMSQEGEWKRHEDQPLGYAMVLFAAKEKVPYVGLLTNMNHHDTPISATFDLFYDRSNEHQRQEFVINGSKCIMFDERDLSSAYLMKDGSFSEQSPYNLSDEKADSYVREGDYGFQRVKNWKAVLEALEVKNE